ncbi:TPA: hypothetical protein ACK3JH_000143 [Mannheimia haemolytica]
MRIKEIIFLFFCIGFVASILGLNHYRLKAEKNAVALQQVQKNYDENQKMLQKYQQQMSKLTTALNVANAQAEQRKQLLQEVLANEKNQKWRDEPVPDDVIRLFKERSRRGEAKINLPANHGMSGNQPASEH